MTTLAWLAVAAAVAVVLYGGFVLALVLAGRRADARAFARLVPDCVVLLRRLLGDPRVRRRHKLVLAATVAYLALPFDLVPDVIPVAGQLDDVLVVVLALRAVLRAAGPELVAEHWPGSPAMRDRLVRLVTPRPRRRPPAAARAARRR